MSKAAFYGWKLLIALWVILFVNLAFPAYGSSVINDLMVEDLGQLPGGGEAESASTQTGRASRVHIGSYTLAFVGTAILCFAGTLVLLCVRPPKRTQSDQVDDHMPADAGLQET